MERLMGWRVGELAQSKEFPLMSSSSIDRPSNTLWLIAHERDDPMVLAQTEHEPGEASAELKRLLRNHAAEGLHIEPPAPAATPQIGVRHEVSDASGWLATYWLSEGELAGNDGMLTAVVSPGARQRSHYTTPLN